MRIGVKLGKITVGVLSLSVLVVMSACGEHSTPQTTAPKSVNAAKQQPTPTLVAGAPVYDFLGELPFVKKQRISNLRRTWRRVPENRNFAVAQSSPEQSSPIYNYGEIAGAYGLALMVVDKTKTQDNRFGLVVFIERPADAYTVHWIYKDTDLRRFKMGRSSGDIFVTETLSDGSAKACEIQWTKRLGKWNCEP